MLDFVDGVDLPVTEVVDERIKEELQKLLDVGILLNVFFLSSNAPTDRIVPYNTATRKNETMNQRFTTPSREEIGINKYRMSRWRGRPAQKSVIWQANRTIATVFRIKHHLLVLQQRVDEPDVPALALLFRSDSRSGGCPANRIR
ncbi:MAG: hypothetical protein R2912_01215 [Eubacteriales bacterium]